MIYTLPHPGIRYHLQFHCPACGLCWAKVPAGVEIPGIATLHLPHRRICATCPSTAGRRGERILWETWGDIPGSLWYSADLWAPGLLHLDRVRLIRELTLGMHFLVDMGALSDYNAPIPSDPSETHMAPDLMLRIMNLRRKEETKDITDDELREAIVILREGRIQAAASATKAKAPKAKAVAMTGDQVLDLF